MSVKILTVGAGGYGRVYVRALLDHIDDDKKYEYSGVVDINIEACPYVEELRERGIPIYTTMEEYFAGNKADLVIISTPIAFHAQQSIFAVEQGACVLCEKPIAASYADARMMCDAARRTGKFIAIGYQYAYSRAILELKRDILQGLFGKPKKLKTLVLFPRGWWYYKRGWAGRIKDSRGNLVLDSVISNATAHYLHNMLFIMGDEMHKAVLPYKYSAEILRENRIENFDTAVLRMETEDGVELMMFASHSIKKEIRPTFEFQYEKALITFGMGQELTARFYDGRIKVYGNPDKETDMLWKLWDTIDAVNSGVQLPCVAETAVPHNMIINSLYEHCEIQDVLPELIVEDKEEGSTIVVGLDESLINGYNQGRMLSELGNDWINRTDFYIDIERKSE